MRQKQNRKQVHDERRTEFDGREPKIPFGNYGYDELRIQAVRLHVRQGQVGVS